MSWLRNKTAVLNIVLVANALVWYSAILYVLMDVVGTVGQETGIESAWRIPVWVIHFSALILSALAGATFAKKMERARFLALWMALGVLSSFALIGLSTSNVLVVSVLALILGVSLGFGMPTCMSYYSDCIPTENKGRISGIALLITGIGVTAFSVLTTENVILLTVVLALWRLSSFLVFASLKSSVTMQNKSSSISYKNIIDQRAFLTYLLPWIMFSLVNYLTAPLQPVFGGEVSNTAFLVKTLFLGVFAVIGGFAMDSIGRKRIAIAGFAMLGLSAAALGLSPSNIFSLYFSSILEGIAWGFLLVLFLFIVWGDLSYSSPSEKFYAIGVAPYFISKLMQLTVGGYIASTFEIASLFPFVSFFLFLAVLPLVYAPETLPEKMMKDRDLKSYVEKALKKVQKEEKSKPMKEEKESTDNEESKESPEDEEARKLAEKYY